jgi:CDP-4-dehydro-6-deoxyglucose reductase, E3
MPSRTIVELVHTEALSPTAKSLLWRSENGRPLEYIAGQWFNFDVETPHGVVRRAYSIASAPDAARPDQFEIAVTRVVLGGAASHALHELEPGARLSIDGPHGFFTREGARDLPGLFVGTGTGLCPLRAMLEDELRSGDGPPLSLLFGCRSEADILWRTQIETWAARHPRFSYQVTLSRGLPQWTGLRGYVQSHLPALVTAGARPHIYVCGLTKMVGEVRRIAKERLGYDRRLIHSERYD